MFLLCADKGPVVMVARNTEKENGSVVGDHV